MADKPEGEDPKRCSCECGCTATAYPNRRCSRCVLGTHANQPATVLGGF
jgi:hypothetical protein